MMSMEFCSNTYKRTEAAVIWILHYSAILYSLQFFNLVFSFMNVEKTNFNSGSDSITQRCLFFFLLVSASIKYVVTIAEFSKRLAGKL